MISCRGTGRLGSFRPRPYWSYSGLGGGSEWLVLPDRWGFQAARGQAFDS